MKHYHREQRASLAATEIFCATTFSPIGRNDCEKNESVKKEESNSIALGRIFIVFENTK